MALVGATCGGEDEPQPCEVCGDLVGVVCDCFGAGSVQCDEAKGATEQTCEAEPERANDGCAAALTGYDCARERDEAGVFAAEQR